MAANTNPAFNPLDLVIPGYAVEQQAMQRQRDLAMALQQQGMTAPEGQMISGHYVAPSSMSYISKIGQALIGKSTNEDLDRKAVENSMRNNAAMAEVLRTGQMPGAGAPAGDAPNMPMGSGMSGVGGMSGASQSTAPSSGGGSSPFSISNVMRGKILGSLGGDQASAAFWKQFEPTDLVKTMTAAGIDPQSPQGQQILQANISKTNYVAPVNAREGSSLLDPVTHLPVFNAPNKDGIQYTFDAQGKPTANMVPGFTDALSQFEAAKKKGVNQQTIAPKELLPTGPDGKVTPTTIDATINGPQGLDIAKLDPATLEYLKQRDPQAYAAGIAKLAATTAPKSVGAAFGQEQGAKDAQSELSKKWSTQQAANQGAETSTSYLQNISKLADKAATGRFSDRIDFVNSLLSSVGNEKATDAVTANNLMKKYQSQIIQQLGGGSAGTDAFRAIIGDGSPGAQMNVPAIKEAVANLIGKNDMAKARTNILISHANSRDPVGYSQKETVFDQNADPRIWQWKSIQDPKAKAAFAASVMKSDPNFPAKIQALEKIGAF